MTYCKFFPFFLLWIVVGCHSPKPLVETSSESGTASIAFYNVENLFDIQDDPDTRDEEFTPLGKKKWTAQRYQKKIGQVSEVFKAMDYPDLIGLCEVENEKVLRDLANFSEMAAHDYQIVHYDSPDARGIDNGFLYKSNTFKVLDSKFISISFPPEIVKDYSTRDILYIKGLYRNVEPLHVFVNHWPSRRGGVAKSEAKRVYVAQMLRNEIEEIFAKDATANILVMGDFNDETDNRSIVEILKAKKTSTSSDILINLSASLDEEGKGSYRYRENWNMLDQIIVSPALNDGKGVEISNATIFSPDFLIYEDKKYGARPNKTYGGPNYYGGYSDHYPIRATISW